MADDGLINATLVISASHYALITGKRNDVLPAYYHHKTEAIRIINEKLSDSELMYGDNTLSAIASLTISEVSFALESQN